MRTPSPASVVSHHQFTKTHQPARRLSDLLYPSRLCSAMDDSAGEADGRSQVSRNRGALLSSAPQPLSRSSTALAGGIAPPGRSLTRDFCCCRFTCAVRTPFRSLPVRSLPSLANLSVFLARRFWISDCADALLGVLFLRQSRRTSRIGSRAMFMTLLRLRSMLLITTAATAARPKTHSR
jgi:hypothetical protein